VAEGGRISDLAPIGGPVLGNMEIWNYALLSMVILIDIYRENMWGGKYRGKMRESGLFGAAVFGCWDAAARSSKVKYIWKTGEIGLYFYYYWLFSTGNGFEGIMCM
jgi:hypothetical protein